LPSISAVTAAYLLGSVMLAPVALTQPLRWALTFSGLALVVYLGVVTMGVGNVFATVGLRSIGPGPAATLLLTDPLTATALGLLVLGEDLRPIGAVGLLLVVASLVLQGQALTHEPVRGRRELAGAVEPWGVLSVLVEPWARW
jgi:drug/metabolite transporter, DME family